MQYQDYDYGTDSDAAPWTASTTSTTVMAPAAPSQVMPHPTTAPITVSSPAAPSADMMLIGSMLRSMQHTQMQQTYMLRDMDSRLSRLEDAPRYTQQPMVVPPPSFERGTWWALWGLLMLVLGGALAVVMILLLMNIQFR